MTPRQFIKKTFGHHVTNGKGIEPLLIKYAEHMINLFKFSQSLHQTGRSVSEVNYTSRYTTLDQTKQYICLSIDDIEASVRAFIRQHGMTTDMLFGEFDGEVLKLSVLTTHKDKRSAYYFGMLTNQPIVDTDTMIVTSLPTLQLTGTNTQRISYINQIVDNLC
jgi:hypothetical protein